MPTEDPGLVILSLDGGGARGLSSLLILKECMKTLQDQLGLETMPEVYEYFDFIGGTGTGGISAAMLGRLRMPLDNTIEQFSKLAKDVFADAKYFSISGISMFKSTKLQQALRDIIREATGNENERTLDRQSDTEKCKTVIFAAPQSGAETGPPRAFRSYQTPDSHTSDCTLWETLCATTAHPDLFKSVDVNDGATKSSFVNAGFGCSNPLPLILSEVKRVYPDRYVSCIISIGTGHVRTLHIPESSPFQRLLPDKVIEAIKSVATDNEQVAVDMARRFRNVLDVYFRFSMDRGTQGVELDDWEQLEPLEVQTREYLQYLEDSGTIRESAAAIKRKHAVIEVASIDSQLLVRASQQVGCTGVRIFPHPTSLFVGRELPAQQVTSYLLLSTTKKVFVIYGLSGTGKSQMALYVIEKTLEHWSDILYADATSVETIEAAFKTFAALKGIGNSYQDTLRWLVSNSGHWLLVLDNADAPSVEVRKYLPDCSHGSIIITTSKQEMTNLGQGPDSYCTVSGMEPDEAFQLLVKASQRDNEDLAEGEIRIAKDLLEYFGYLPLAIVQAAGYISMKRCSFSQYQELYLNQPEDMLPQHHMLPSQADKYERAMINAWALNYAQLGSIAQRLLQMMALMQRDQIALEIFQRAATNMSGLEPPIPFSDPEQEAYNYVKDFLNGFIDSAGHWDCDSFLGVMSDLRSYSLVDYDRVSGPYTLHPLVQSWAQMAVSDTTVTCLHTAHILAASLNWDEYFADYAFCQSLHLHVARISKYFTGISSNLVPCLANVLCKSGMWDMALSMQAEVAMSRRSMFGGEHLETAKATSYLAQIHFNRGGFKQAEELQVQVLDAVKQTLGEKHPETLAVMNDLAKTYYVQGCLKEAEDLQMKVLDGTKIARGEDHPDTLTAMINLADTYSKQRYLGQAEKLQAHVLNSRKQVLGTEHPDTLTAMNNLAITYSDQGRPKQAEEQFSRVLDARKRVLGKEHTDTLGTMCSLANTHYIQGALEQAAELQAQVLEARKRLLGEDHIDTLTVMSNLAITYCDQGRLKQAEVLEVQVFNGRVRVLGMEHPDTLTAMRNLADTYYSQGRLEQAEELQAQVSVAMRRVLGEDHPDTLAAINDLATTYFDQGRLEMATELRLEVLDIRKRVLGEDHHDTLIAMNSLAIIYGAQKRLKEAGEIRLQVLNARKRVLGEAHPDTLSTMSNLANTYYIQGLLKQAEELQVQVLETRTRVLGKEHPDTLTAMNNLAITYFDQGQLKQTEQLEEQVLDVRKRTLGLQHPDTLRAMRHLSATYKALGFRYRHVYKALKKEIKRLETLNQSVGA